MEKTQVLADPPSPTQGLEPGLFRNASMIPPVTHAEDDSDDHRGNRASGKVVEAQAGSANPTMEAHEPEAVGPQKTYTHERKGSASHDDAVRRGLTFERLGAGVEQSPAATETPQHDDSDQESAEIPPGDHGLPGTRPPPYLRRTTSKSFPLPKSPKRKRENTPLGERFIPPGELDLETLDDMELAQRLGITIEQEDHPPNRTVRRIVRGDPAGFKGKGGKEPRRYLLGANLAEESKYAIECALGTVLRDGEVLIITFAIDKNSKTGRPQEGVDEKDDSSTAQAIASEANSLYEHTARKPSRFESLKTWVPGSRKPSVASEHLETKDQERQRAADELVTTCVHFLRRTALQVSVLVEVIHCQNAQHMLMAAVDSVQPALVIVGSRGLSQVHGSIGTSFSRAMIRKSSVPVMTARMKPSSKVQLLDSEKFMGNNLRPTENLVELSAQDHEQRQSRWEEMQEVTLATSAEAPVEAPGDGKEPEESSN